MAMLQAQLAKKRLKAVECTFFSSFAHQLYNDPSYHMASDRMRRCGSA